MAEQSGLRGGCEGFGDVQFYGFKLRRFHDGWICCSVITRYDMQPGPAGTSPEMKRG